MLSHPSSFAAAASLPPPSQQAPRSLTAAALAAHNPDSLSAWLRLYWNVVVVGAPAKTAAAKRQDLERFLTFFTAAVGGDALDDWTPAVTRAFIAELRSAVSAKTQAPLSATSINRVLASVGHLARWVHAQRPLLAGSPMLGVKAMSVDAPSWNGLTPQQVLRLRCAIEQRAAHCLRQDQRPHLEAAVFFTLLHTGLREHELVALQLSDYHHRGFHHVKRKGNNVTRKVAVPAEACAAIDRYIDKERGSLPGALLLSRQGCRLTTRGVAYICARLARQASVSLPEAQRFHLAPHQLRHTFLKRVADKHGLHHAHAMSGNVSVREVFRYAKPSDDEMALNAEGLF